MGKRLSFFPVASAHPPPRRKPVFKVRLLLVLCCPALTAPKEAPVFIRCLRSSRISSVLLDLGGVQQLMCSHAYANKRAGGIEGRRRFMYMIWIKPYSLLFPFLYVPMPLAHIVDYMPPCVSCSLYRYSGWTSACWYARTANGQKPAGDRIFSLRHRGPSRAELVPTPRSSFVAPQTDRLYFPPLPNES